MRDFALIPYNAQVFNRQDSGAFQDALVVKEQLEQQLQKFVEKGVISKDVAELPYLGEIPTYEEDIPMEDADAEAGEEEEESDEADEEDEDEEEPDLDDEGRPMLKKRRGRPPGSKTRTKDKDVEEGGDGKRSRGRPPKLLTPMEARILAVLKGLRKPKNNRGQLIIKHFDRLPDKATMPEYYVEIKNPMAYDVLKRKVKRKKYATLEAFMSEVNLMLNNAKEYNTDDSQIFKDAVQLQIEAGKLYDAEKAKSDDTFADDEGKVPMPNGILHNGELYKVGDWVHIQNLNDLTKPIPAQIYRTYKNPAGQSIVNVCWYYRPEQTVHRFDKHFLSNEVVKTGRYRDHNISEVEGKCFIMFYTRYFKGRPRGLSEGTEVYVCKDRYNELLGQFNTIKTWASCLPDEVRDRDYEMDLFDTTRRMKKYPSPIAYLLKDDQKETDDLPKPTWGAEGAPPKIGMVHRRPRNEKDSPPPEPTPPPPPPKPVVETPAPRPVQSVAPNYQNSSLTGASQQRPPSASSRLPHAYPANNAQAAPSPISGGVGMAPSPQRPLTMNQTSNYNNAGAMSTPQQPNLQSAAPRPTMPSHQYSSSSSSYQQHHQQPQNIAPTPTPGHHQYPGTGLPRTPNVPGGSYRDPPPIEVYTLPDQANLSIPAEVRELYQRDENGRVLFFTTPPVAANAASSEGVPTGHSVRYLAARVRRQEELARRRSEAEAARESEEREAKKARLANEKDTEGQLEALKKKAMGVLEQKLAEGILDGEMGDVELGNLSAAQRAMSEQMQAVHANGVKRMEMRRVRLDDGGSKGYRDDWEM